MSSIRSEVGLALKSRLETIKFANGYPIDIRQVYYDEIPLGLELAPEDMPAIFLLDEGATYRHLHSALEVMRAWRLQLIDNEESSDEHMNLIIRNISKAIWSNSPTSQSLDAFRFHSRVYQVDIESDDTDLRMIEGNRIATVRLLVHYRTKPNDL